MNKIEKFFDSCAKDWDKNEIDNLNRIKLINSLPLKMGDLVLDVGCGTGAISKILYDITKRTIIGIDISSEMIKIAKSKYSSDIVNYYNANYYDFKYNELFDIIVVFNAYPHFLDTDMFIKASLNNLKENGYLIIIHDISKDEINDCHKNLDNDIKRELRNPISEYNNFKYYFDLVKSHDDKHKYLIILKKKQTE